MIAAGIFTLSGLAVRNAGSSAIIAFLLAASVALLTALSYCEFSSIYTESGEGYLYTRKTFPAPLAFVVGWALLLGYTASCAFYLASLSTYFQEFILALPFEAMSGLLVLVLLAVLNVRGTEESSRFQIFVTGAKVLLLIGFVIGGLRYFDPGHFMAILTLDLGKIGGTAAMVFITFFGFSAIAASAGEVRNPTRTIPRAIFLSVGIVSVLYVLVIMAVVSGKLTEYDESAIGRAAELFLGPIGGMVIIAGALFSMLSASNASIMAGSRVAFTMSRLDHLPGLLGRIHPARRTPAGAILAMVTGIGLFLLVLPLEGLAHFADTVLLLAMVLVNLALIAHRRRYPELERPFRVPLVPALPLLAVASNVVLLAGLVGYPVPFWLAIATLLLGFVSFLAWSYLKAPTRRLEGQPSLLAYQDQPGEPAEAYRILVPVANPTSLATLVTLACRLARPREGRLVGLRVVWLPEQLPLSEGTAYVEGEYPLLEQARLRAEECDVPIQNVIRVSHHIGRAILEEGDQRDCELILLGWKGYSSARGWIFGEDVDLVVSRARTDILLVKLGPTRAFQRLLVPVTEGRHSRLAQSLAGAIARDQDAVVTLCHVIPSGTPEQAARSLLDQAAERLRSQGLERVRLLVLQGASPAQTLVAESSQYDAVVLGASDASFSPRVLFGAVAEQVGREAPGSVLVAKAHHPLKDFVGRVLA